MSKNRFDAVVVGAGFAGMYLLIRLRELGLSVRVLEKGLDVGGTWYWNRYPGARCDIESFQYSYSFSDELQQEWDWSERYATQPEILRYARHVADRFDLRRHIQFSMTVMAARYEESERCWQLDVVDADGSHTTVESNWCVMATGCLSVPNVPSFPNADAFAGPIYHTGDWPRSGVDFSDQRVAVIGTGSSGIQSIPLIAEQAKHLTVFQRTPNFIVPAQNRMLDSEEKQWVKSRYEELRALAKTTRNGIAFEAETRSALSVSAQERETQYESQWKQGGLPFALSFPDLLRDPEANSTAAEFVAKKIELTVHDQDTARLLTPDYTFACKRLCVDTGYYETFNRDNVELVDIIESGITGLDAEGIVIGNKTYAVDAIVLATGFDAITGALKRIDIRGRNGLSLSEKWRHGPVSYLGLMIAEFPNLFTVTGPGSPSVLSNMLGSIEFHVDWITNCIEFTQSNAYGSVEAISAAETSWVKEVSGVVDRTLYRTCQSWYLGSNIPGKPRVFMPYPGVPDYIDRCNQIVSENYKGFSFGR
ncbi:MAG: NAD(P)/FAD-dependent oxidoreductase [Pseudomonadota bacterium]